MNEQQSGYLKSLVDTAVRSALMAWVWRQPPWIQAVVFAGGGAVMLFWLGT